MNNVTQSRVAVVTGGARGIGLAIGDWFLAHGHRVALIDIDGATLDRDRRRARPTRRRARHPLRRLRPGAGATAPRPTVMAPLRPHRCARQQRRRRGVQADRSRPSFDEWRRVLATNLDGAFLCTQACAPRDAAAAAAAAIVNIASISGLRASTLRVAYGTSKAALIHLTKQQAVELGNVGIRVNAIAPGPGRDRDGQAGAQRGDPLRLSRRDPAGPLRHDRRRSPTRSASCAAPRPATSTARCSRSTAASMRRASGCRRCAGALPRPAATSPPARMHTRRRPDQPAPIRQEISVNQPFIIGWGHTPFGKLDAVDLEQLFRDAAQPALRQRRPGARGHRRHLRRPLQRRLRARRTSAPRWPALAIPEFRHTPAVRIENACATGSAAIWAALDAVAAGRMKRALVVGFEKMNALPTPQIGETLLRCSYVKEEGDDAGRFRRRLRQHRQQLLRALRRPVATRWRRSRPRTTPTACATRTPTCGATWASTSAARRRTRTRSWPGR